MEDYHSKTLEEAAVTIQKEIDENETWIEDIISMADKVDSVVVEPVVE